MKIFWIIFLSVVVFLSGCKQNGKTDTIKVGAVNALTGFDSYLGESERNAIELLKAKHGENSKIEFFIENSRSDVTSGFIAVNKLVNINKCNIVYCDLSSIVDAVSSITSKNKVTLIAPVYLENLKDNPYAIRNLPSFDQENAALIRFVIDNYIVHDNIAVLYANDVFGRTCFNSFKSLIPKESSLCYTSVIDETALWETALKAIASNPDVIYLGSISRTLGSLVKFLRQNGYNKEIITTNAFSYDNISSVAGEYAKGVRYVDFMDNERYGIFRNEYKRKFGIECVPSAMLCYDGISAVLSSLINGKSLEGSTYEGLTGTLIIKNQEIIYPIQVLTWE